MPEFCEWNAMTNVVIGHSDIGCSQARNHLSRLCLLLRDAGGVKRVEDACGHSLGEGDEYDRFGRLGAMWPSLSVDQHANVLRRVSSDGELMYVFLLVLGHWDEVMDMVTRWLKEA